MTLVGVGGEAEPLGIFLSKPGRTFLGKAAARGGRLLGSSDLPRCDRLQPLYSLGIGTLVAEWEFGKVQGCLAIVRSRAE